MAGKYKLAEPEADRIDPKPTSGPNPTGAASVSSDNEPDPWADFEPPPELGEDPEPEAEAGAAPDQAIILSPEQFRGGLAVAIGAINTAFPKPFATLDRIAPGDPQFAAFADAVYRRAEAHAPWMLRPGSQAAMDWAAIGLFAVGIAGGIRAELAERRAERAREAAARRQDAKPAPGPKARPVNDPPDEGPGADQGAVVLGVAS